MNPKLLKAGAIGLLLIILLGAVVILITARWIHHDARSICAQACREMGRQYPAETAEALIAYVQSERPSLREKNRAIWAMGYIKPDPRVTAALDGVTSTGHECNHMVALCQYEIEKARAKQKDTRWMMRMLRLP